MVLAESFNVSEIIPTTRKEALATIKQQLLHTAAMRKKKNKLNQLVQTIPRPCLIERERVHFKARGCLRRLT